MIFAPVVVLEAVEAGESGPAVVAHVVPGAGDLGAAPLPTLPPLSFIIVVVVAALKVGVPLEVLQVFAPGLSFSDVVRFHEGTEFPIPSYRGVFRIIFRDFPQLVGRYSS